MENLRRFIQDIDGVESELKIEITEENGFPDYPIDSTDDEGTSWYVINDQYCKKSPNGQYVYHDENGNEQDLLLQGTRQKVIKITLDWNDHLYSGIVTEDQISSQQLLLTIDDLYEELVEELKNHKEIQEGPIKLKIQQGKTIELQYSYEVRVSKVKKTNHSLIFKLVEQEETQELIFQKKLKKMEKTFEIKMNDQNKTQDQQVQQIYDKIEQKQQEASSQFNLELQNQNSQLREEIQAINKKYDEQSKRFEILEYDQNENKTKVQQLREEIQAISKKDVEQSKRLELLESHSNDNTTKVQQLIEEIQAISKKYDEQSKRLELLEQNPNDNTTKVQQLIEEIQAISKKYDEQSKRLELLEQNQNDNQNQSQEQKEVIQPDNVQQLTIQNLQKTKGFFSVLPQSLTGVIVIQFRIKVLPQNGLVLGLDHTTNPVQNTPAYGIFLNHQVLVVGQDRKSFDYVPKVDDQIYFMIDMNKRIAVLHANQQQVVDFKFEDQQQTELYLCVGFFAEQEDITQYIE